MAARRGYGTIRKLPSGRWQARRWEYGVQVSAPQTFAIKADANAWLSAVETDVARSQFIDPANGTVTFGAYARSGCSTRPTSSPARGRPRPIPSMGASTLVRLCEGSGHRSWWQTASIVNPNGSRQNPAKYDGGYCGNDNEPPLGRQRAFAWRSSRHAAFLMLVRLPPDSVWPDWGSRRRVATRATHVTSDDAVRGWRSDLSLRHHSCEATRLPPQPVFTQGSPGPDGAGSRTGYCRALEYFAHRWP